MRHRQIEYHCQLSQGLHARPATQLVEVCQRFSANIEWHNRRNNRRANAKSVLALLGSDTLYGDYCQLTVSGHDASLVVKTLRHFLFHDLLDTDDSNAVSGSFMLPRSLYASQSQIYPAMSAGSGCARGELVLFQTPDVIIPSDLPAEDCMLQQQLLRTTLIQLQQQINRQRLHVSGQTAQVLQTHWFLLQDGFFEQWLLDVLPTSHSLAHAIVSIQQRFQTEFLASNSCYMQARELDLRDLCQQLLALGYPRWAQLPKLQLKSASVVLADELTPSQFLSLAPRHLHALLLTNATQTSHTVVLAKAAGIPILTGLADANLKQAAGKIVIVDAKNGFCLLQPDAIAERFYWLDAQTKHQRQQQLQLLSQLPGESADGQRLDVAANITAATEASMAFQAGAESIGLFRTEMLFMNRDFAPDEEEQYQAYKAVLQAAAGRSVIIRTVDIGGDKPVAYLSSITEANPFLGVRGVRLYPYQETLFRSQLRALLRAAIHGVLNVMLPMVVQPEEVQWVRRLLHEELNALHAAQIPAAMFSLGMMLEIPAAAFQMVAFCPLVDFFSIGSNDLMQYLLAVDRTNPRVARYYQPAHPALWILLQQMVTQAHLYGCWIGLCGELAGDHRFLPLLLGLGLDEISLGVSQIAETKAALAKLNAGQCQRLLTQVCTAESSEQLLMWLRDAAVAKTPSMLSIDNITLDMPWQNKAEVLKGMSDQLWLAGRTHQPQKVEQTLWLREDAYSTGLGHGIALPHARTDAVIYPTISIARLASPVEWGALDGQPVDFVIMLTSNERQAADEHLRIFSRLARRMVYDDFRSQLRGTLNAAELCGLLQQELAV